MGNIYNNTTRSYGMWEYLAKTWKSYIKQNNFDYKFNSINNKKISLKEIYHAL